MLAATSRTARNATIFFIDVTWNMVIHDFCCDCKLMLQNDAIIEEWQIFYVPLPR